MATTSRVSNDVPQYYRQIAVGPLAQTAPAIGNATDYMRQLVMDVMSNDGWVRLYDDQWQTRLAQQRPEVEQLFRNMNSIVQQQGGRTGGGGGVGAGEAGAEATARSRSRGGSTAGNEPTYIGGNFRGFFNTVGTEVAGVDRLPAFQDRRPPLADLEVEQPEPSSRRRRISALSSSSSSSAAAGGSGGGEPTEEEAPEPAARRRRTQRQRFQEEFNVDPFGSEVGFERSATVGEQPSVLRPSPAPVAAAVAFQPGPAAPSYPVFPPEHEVFGASPDLTFSPLSPAEEEEVLQSGVVGVEQQSFTAPPPPVWSSLPLAVPLAVPLALPSVLPSALPLALPSVLPSSFLGRALTQNELAFAAASAAAASAAGGGGW